MPMTSGPVNETGLNKKKSNFWKYFLDFGV